MTHSGEDCDCDCHVFPRGDRKEMTCILCYKDADECPSCEGIYFEDIDELCLECKKEFQGESEMRDEIMRGRL